MFKNLLTRNKQPPTPTTEEDLDKKMRGLQEQRFQLTSLMTAEKHFPTKTRLLEEREKIDRQLRDLKLRQLPQQERQALEEINKLFKERRYILKINGKERKPKKSLITLTFIPCGHKKTIFQHELLTYQATTYPIQVWLSKYQSIFNTTCVLTRSVNCIQCRELHPSILSGKEIPIGNAKIELSIF